MQRKRGGRMRVRECQQPTGVPSAASAAVELHCPLPLTVRPTPRRGRSSSELATQLQQSFKNAPVIPLTWRPADMDAEVPVFVPAPAPASPPPVSMFPSVPKGPVGR